MPFLDESLELDRLDEVFSLHLPYDELRERLAPHVKLAKAITNSPTCEINIIDAYYQWTIAGANDNFKVIPREESICHDTIAQPISNYEIEDLSKHDRYHDRSYVKGSPHFKYYCGVKLTTSAGQHIGSLCVLDKKSKLLSKPQKEQLNLLGDTIVDLIENEKKQHLLTHQFYQLKDEVQKFSHDLRGPVGGIVGLVDVIKSDLEENEEAAGMLDDIRDCGLSVLEQMDVVLGNSDSPIRTGKTIDSIRKSILALYKPRAESKDIALSISSDTADMRLTPRTYDSAVKIIGNLISNGLKFTSAGGEVSVALRIEGGEEKSLLSAAVTDNGRGMSDDQVEAFNNGLDVKRAAGTAGEQSFGIGLRHVRELTFRNDGTIRVMQRDTGGTRFELRLPLN